METVLSLAVISMIGKLAFHAQLLSDTIVKLKHASFLIVRNMDGKDALLVKKDGW